MAGAGKRKVEIGFDGGQVLPARLTEEALKELRAAVDAGAGWLDLDTEEGTIALDLARVLFIRIAAADQRVGF